MTTRIKSGTAKRNQATVKPLAMPTGAILELLKPFGELLALPGVREHACAQTEQAIETLRELNRAFLEWNNARERHVERTLTVRLDYQEPSITPDEDMVWEQSGPMSPVSGQPLPCWMPRRLANDAKPRASAPWPPDDATTTDIRTRWAVLNAMFNIHVPAESLTIEPFKGRDRRDEALIWAVFVDSVRSVRSDWATTVSAWIQTLQADLRRLGYISDDPAVKVPQFTIALFKCNGGPAWVDRYPEIHNVVETTRRRLRHVAESSGLLTSRTHKNIDYDIYEAVMDKVLVGEHGMTETEALQVPVEKVLAMLATRLVGVAPSGDERGAVRGGAVDMSKWVPLPVVAYGLYGKTKNTGNAKRWLVGKGCKISKFDDNKLYASRGDVEAAIPDGTTKGKRLRRHGYFGDDDATE